MRNCLLAIAMIALGCGDNSRSCGPGTLEEAGYCVPTATCGFGTKPDEATGECVPDGTTVCSEGTVFDELTGSCQIDPAACQNGTVLIDGQCVDPAVGLVADVQEGPEPNGLGIVEASDAQAGNAYLKAAGEPAFVIHGSIQPHRDMNGDGALDPDVDTYVVSVGAPSLVQISADGVGGITAGFVMVTTVGSGEPLAGWRRFGIDLVGDTSKRQVFLPAAGTYQIAIGDTRTLGEYAAGDAVTSAPGGGEYYVSMTTQAMPTPTALTVTNGTATLTSNVTADNVQFYSVALGTGLNRISLAMPSPLAVGAVVVSTNDAFRAAADENGGPARVIVGSVGAADTTVIAVDHVSNASPAPMPFTLDVSTSNATLLSKTGGTVSALASTNSGSDFSKLNLFAFDVAAADAAIAIDLAWNAPVVGQLYDGVGAPVAAFTNPSTSTATWTAYRGFMRVPTAGRYYFAVFAPSATPNMTMIAASSRLAEPTAQPIAAGTPVSSPLGTTFTYEPGSEPWHGFDVTGTNTGGQLVAWFDPASAYGRLDPLVTSTGTLAREAAPLFAHSYSTAGGTIGRIALGDPASYLVTLAGTNPSGAAMATLSFGLRPAATDLGTLGATAITRTGETIDTVTPARYYFVRVAANKTVTITVTPTSQVNTQFRRLAADESPLGPLVNTSNQGADVETFTQPATGWTAFVVSSSGGLSGARTFDVSVAVQ